jgi:hypothetical protein
LGYILGDFLTNSSGHPEIGAQSNSVKRLKKAQRQKVAAIVTRLGDFSTFWLGDCLL